MKRFYIAPKSVWLAHVDLFDVEGTSHVELPAGSPDGASPDGVKDGHVLINTDFKSSWAEGVWHEHAEVARLAHPHYESQVPLAHLHQHAQHGHKKFQKHHFDKLNGLLAVSELQPIDDTHTLWDLHARLIGKYPGLILNRY